MGLKRVDFVMFADANLNRQLLDRNLNTYDHGFELLRGRGRMHRRTHWHHHPASANVILPTINSQLRARGSLDCTLQTDFLGLGNTPASIVEKAPEDVRSMQRKDWLRNDSKR